MLTKRYEGLSALMVKRAADLIDHLLQQAT
jgi:hypothetical protein